MTNIDIAALRAEKPLKLDDIWGFKQRLWYATKLVFGLLAIGAVTSLTLAGLVAITTPREQDPRFEQCRMALDYAEALPTMTGSSHATFQRLYEEAVHACRSPIIDKGE